MPLSHCYESKDKTWVCFDYDVSKLIVCRLYGDSVESGTFYEDSIVKLIWKDCFGFSWRIKLPHNLHINFIIKSL